MKYIPKSGSIYITTLTLANTWYAVLTEAQSKAVRGIKMKSRYTYGQQSGNPFDYAFSASPGEDYISNTGAGWGEEFAPTSGIWARSAIAGTIIEILTYE